VRNRRGVFAAALLSRRTLADREVEVFPCVRDRANRLKRGRRLRTGQVKGIMLQQVNIDAVEIRGETLVCYPYLLDVCLSCLCCCKPKGIDVRRGA